jgi:hypothetical protein
LKREEEEEKKGISEGMVSRRLDNLSAGNTSLEGNKMCSIIKTIITH